MDNIELELLKQIVDLNKTPDGAYNIRKNGQGIERKITENVNIVTKEDKQGIDVFVKENTKFKFIGIFMLGMGIGEILIVAIVASIIVPMFDMYSLIA